MYSFKNDYSEGACQEIVQAMIATNQVQHAGYSEDSICEEARVLIKKELKNEQADIHFLVGGTQANLTVIASVLRPFEAVIAVDSGHINVHETGAIEACGHKVLVSKGIDGKLQASEVENIVLAHTDEHMVKPRMVYISNATEIGTIYSKTQLQALHEVCKQYGLYLYMDGARLPQALMAIDNDLTLVDIASLCDVFYMGGTKCGAMFGEAVVIMNDKLKPDFRFMMKQRGGMLAKGRLLGIQFRELFQHNLYYKLAKHANHMASQMQTAILQAGYPLFVDSTTNQIFPILPDGVIKKLSVLYAYTPWQRIDEHHEAVRFVTSWATPQSVVDAFIKDILTIK